MMRRLSRYQIFVTAEFIAYAAVILLCGCILFLVYGK